MKCYYCHSLFEMLLRLALLGVQLYASFMISTNFHFGYLCLSRLKLSIVNAKAMQISIL